MRAMRALYMVAIAVGIEAACGLAAGGDVRTLVGHTALVRSVAFSPSGTMLASGSMDSTIKVWDVGSGDVLVTLPGHVGLVRSVAFSPDGRLLASGGVDGTVKLWEVGTWAELRRLDHLAAVNSVAFSPDGVLLVTACTDTRVRLWDIAAGKEVLVLSGHADLVWSVSFSPDGQRVASGSEDGTARLWDVRTGRSLKTLVHTIDGERVPVNTVAFSPDGAVLATGSDANVVELWNVSTGAKVREEPLRGHQARIWSVAFSPDGGWLASGSEDAAAILWTSSNGRKVHTLKGHSATVFSVAFSPDGALLATGSRDGTIRLWPVPPRPVEAVVLAWIPCTDEAEEYANVTTALGFEPTVTRTRDPNTLSVLLDKVGILLIPEQERCSSSDLERMGTACAKALVAFLERGGTVIGMTYVGGADDILRGAGILPGLDDGVNATGDRVAVVAPDHPLAVDVAPSFIAEYGSTGFSGVSADAVVVVKHGSGEPVVFVKKVSAGTVIMLGFDFYSYNAEMAQLLRNAVSIAESQSVTMIPPAQVRVDREPATLLLQDDPPWNEDVVANALTRLGIPFEVTRSPDLATVDLSMYGHIIIPSVQPRVFYDVLADHKGLLETFVRSGGILQFHAAAFRDVPAFSLPGDVKYTYATADPNIVALPDHPVVRDVPSPFKGNLACHGYFTDLPRPAGVITVDPDGRATTVEYRLGSGFVLATAVTVEWGVINGHTYAPMLENLILYARSLLPRGGEH